MRIALVDDREEDLAMLRESLLGFRRLYPITEDGLCPFSGGTSFLRTFRRGKYDLVFLDIYMKDMSGVDTAFRIRKEDPDVPLVFITTSNDFASESYAVRADYYLLKPYTEKQIGKMLELVMPSALSDLHTLELPDGRKLQAEQIMWAESSGHYILLYLDNGYTAKIRMNHAELASVLCRFPFFCSCYRGVLLNFTHVKSFVKDGVLMQNGECVPISRRRYADVKKSYEEWAFHAL